MASSDRNIIRLLSLNKLWELFEDFASGNNPSSGQLMHHLDAFGNISVDWSETAEAHIIRADLPGVKKDKIKVQVEDGRTLVISGERKRDDEEKIENWHRTERYEGNFVRKFVLPENAQTESIKAKFEDGVLTITVPKAKAPKPTVRTITVSKL